MIPYINMASGGNYWFKSKYGFGWYPAGLRGIFVLLLYFAYLIYIFLKTDSNSYTLSDTLIGFAPHLFGATILLLFICYITGEPIKLRKLKF